jgi:uncharacterized membrane protein
MINYFKKHPELLVSLVFTAIACFAAIYLLYDSYKANAFDLGLFTEAIKNTLKGALLYDKMEGFNHLAIHFSPILLLVTPFYWLFQSPITLLVLQSVLIGFSAWLIYYLARYFKLSKRVSLLIEILFCVNPLVWGILLFDFHEICFAVPLLLLMIIGLLQKKWVLFGVSLFLALLVKEDITLTIGALGVSIFIYEWFKTKKISWVAVIMMISAGITLIISLIVSRALSIGDAPRILLPFTLRYHFGSGSSVNSLVALLEHTFDSYSLIMIFAFFAPLCFFSLGTLEWSIPAIGILLMCMVSTWYGQHNQIIQYSAGAIPFLFVGAMMTLARSKYPTEIDNTKNKYNVIGVLVFLILISLVITFFPNNRGAVMKLPDSHTEAITEVLNKIPNGVTVTANNSLEPHLVSRDDVYVAPMQYDGSDKSVWGFPLTLTQYVVVDDKYIQYTVIENGETGLTAWEQQIQPELNQDYILVYQLDGCKLYELRSDVK